jgi:ElaB/YqjD/DUF883 family membrane-anchored ribosome-binding protein
MSHDTKQLLSELTALLAQFESAVHAGRAAASEQGTEAAIDLQAGLKQARARVDDLRQNVQDELDRGVQATEQLVRGQPWLAIGIAAAAAFVLGVVIGRRE